MIFILLLFVLVVGFVVGYYVGQIAKEDEYAGELEKKEYQRQIEELQRTVVRLELTSGPERFQQKLDREVARDGLRVRIDEE